MANGINESWQSDPGAVVLFALKNNPEGVFDRLNALGYPVNDSTGANQAFKKLYAAKGIQGLVDGLVGVPILPQNLTPQEAEAMAAIGYRPGGKRSTDEDGGQGSGAGWDFAGVVIQTLGNVASSYFYSQNTATGSPQQGNYYPYPPAPAQPNYLLWGIIGLIVVVGLFLILRKK